MKTRTFATLSAALLLVLLVLSGCAKKADVVINSIDDLEGKKIGVQLGTTGDIYAQDEVKDAQVEQFNTGAEAVMALKQGKVDCVMIDNEPAKAYVAENDDLKILDEPFADEEYAIAMPKGSPLKAQIDAALTELKEDGTMQSIIDNYIGVNAGHSPYTSPAGTTYNNGTLRVATNAAFPPYEYTEGEKVVGLDIDMAQAICDKLGLVLEVEDMEFDSIIDAIGGKADVGIAGMTVTEDRLKTVDFSVPYTTAKQVIIVKK